MGVVGGCVLVEIGVVVREVVSSFQFALELDEVLL